MSFIKKFLKGLLVVFLILIVVGVGYYFYEENESKKRDERELGYATTQEWVWHDKYDRIQIRTLEEENRSILRKVHMRENYVVFALKDEDYRLSSMVKFVAKCNPNTEIETSEKFSNGVPKTLKCNENGTALTHSVRWDQKDTDITWEENLGGFSLRENFTYWDFSKLDQEITLSKSK
jgi:hypothetical protein